MIENKKLRGRPKTLNKKNVVEVAMQSYWHQGPTEVSLNSVCQKSGVSKPSLYREFGNEDGLACAALENYVQTVMARVIGCLTGEGAFTEKIERLTHLVTEDDQHINGCLFVKMRTAKSSLGEKTQVMITQTESIAVEAYTQFFNDARGNGGWSSNIPVELAAQYLHAQIGLAMAQRARGSNPKAVLKLALSVFFHS